MRTALLFAAWLVLAVDAAAAGSAKPAGPPPARSEIVASASRLGGDEQRTRFVVDLSRKVELAAFTLANPYRVVVDLPEVNFELPASAGKSGRGLISAYRYGLFARGKSRIVLDVTGPVAIDKAFVLDPLDDQPARLVIDLVRIDARAFASNASIVTGTLRAPSPAERATAGDERPLVVIDPGHGGIDTGAIARSGVEEKEVVLAVSKKLADRLAASGRVRVVMTRSDDTFVPLAERVRLAREQRAALFISIHADSISRHDREATGATVYTLSERASDEEAARLADKENKADLIAGIDLSEEMNEVAGILFDLAHRETRNFSGLFARTLVGRMQEAARMHKNPLRSAGFTVLRAPDVPSVLLELGFLSNSDDLKKLVSEPWRDRVAEAMADAVHRFFAERVVREARR